MRINGPVFEFCVYRLSHLNKFFPFCLLQVECSGKGLQGILPVNVPVDFNVDTRKAGNAPLDVKVRIFNSNRP